MKLKALALFLCVLFVNSFAQNHKYYYEYKYVPNINKKDSVLTEMMVLDVKKSGSTYLSNDKFVADSTMMAELEKQVSTGNFNLSMKNNFRAGTVEYQVQKTYPDYKVTLNTKLSMDSYKVLEDKKPEWKISNEKEKIGDYTGQKATTNFGGREWTAWFSSDIPIPDGPYKFYGLPGLIVKMEDASKTHVMTLVANKSYKEVEKKEATVPAAGSRTTRIVSSMSNFGRGEIEVTKEKFKKAYKDYLADPSKGMKQMMSGNSFGGEGTVVSVKMMSVDGREVDVNKMSKQIEESLKRKIRDENNPIEPDLYN